ncbi:cytochrome P450 [Cyathus striatus]|nr:cytochrome P450 [Cyathus striatus]
MLEPFHQVFPPVTSRSVTVAFGCICITYVYSFFRGLRFLKAVHYVPGLRPLFSPTSLLGAILPSTWWNLGHNWSWNLRETSFFNHSHDVISMVPILHGKTCFFTCSVDVLKQILGNEGKTHLTKPQDITLSSITGDNVASVNGDTWRRHRRIVAPAFNAKTYALVREETAKLYEEVVQNEGWDSQDTILIPSLHDFMLKYALIIVARCAFGLPMSWRSPAESSLKGMKLSEAISIVTKSIIARLILPSWAFKLPISSLRHIDRAWETFTGIVKDSVRKRKEALSEEMEGATGDVLGRLVQSFDGEGKYNLSEQEVVADIFTVLFAGHETTASVLTATMACLALYKDEQLKAYEEIKGAFSEHGVLNIDDSNQFPHLQACFQECGRLYPAAFIVARETSDDLPIKVMRPRESTIVLPKGSRIVMDLISIHHNPYVYENPKKFRPSRWYGVLEPDLPMFGFGPRACVGRKFAHTEAVIFLAHILHDWELDIDLKEGETIYDREQRVLGCAGMQGTAFSIGPVELRLKKRI